MIMAKMMKILYSRSSSMTGNTTGEGDSSNALRRLTTTTSLSDSSRTINDSSSRSNQTADSVELVQGAACISGKVNIRIYNDGIDENSVSFDGSDTCEYICLSLAQSLDITPTMLNCFSLGILDMTLKKHYWIAPKQKLSDICYNLMQTQEYRVFFRMRFIPEQSKCAQLDKIDPKCLEYLTWQVKWDFLHSFSSCSWEVTKTDEARGFSCMLILLALRVHSQKENITENLKNFMKKRDLDDFLPVPLRKKLVEGKVLKNNMLKKVEELLKTHPAEKCDTYYIMKWCLQVALKQNISYKIEKFVAYDLDIDHEEFECIDGEEPPSQIVDKQELVITIKIDKYRPTLTVTERNEQHTRTLYCDVGNISKIEIRKTDLDGETWWRVHLFRQDGHPEMLYFEDSKEAYSFATCIECYNRLTVDYYDTVCTELVPSLFNELVVLRAHGPVRDEFVKKKLLKKNSIDLYILRVNLRYYGVYDVLYLPSIATDTELKKVTLPKIVKVEGGYVKEGSGRQPQDLKVLMNDLVREENLFPSTCLRIKPQSEGCDLLYSFILGKEPVDVHEENEEKREKRKIENQPKVYNRNDLKLQTILGQGHFTEVYNGLLLEQHRVVVKKMRVKDIEDGDFRLVQEAFSEGIDKLMTFADHQFFVPYMGMSIMPDLCMILKGTSHGSLRQFLQNREPSLPMLSLHHLLDANIQVASALVFMEEKNCYHGNLHCGNIAVMNYDNRTMIVRICDPGLVTLYNKLPLDHPVNIKRLPWLAPEIHSNLSSTTAQSEVYAYGTTLWQMFSTGLSPIDHDPKLKNKTPDQIVKFFKDGNKLTLPEFLKVKTGDPDEVKEVKDLLYKAMLSCWNNDVQERADPKRLLREINSNTQTYEDTYHKYNIISEYDVNLSTFSADTRSHSSGFNTNDQQVVHVPDISCLKAGSRNSLTSPQNRNENRAQSRSQADISTALLRPVQGQHPPSQAPLAVGATNIVATGIANPSPCLSAVTRIESYGIEKGKLEIDWDTVLGKGHYGEVYKGKLYPKDELMALNPQAGPEAVVIKVLRRETADMFSEDLKKEAKVMQRLLHPNVVKYYDICHGGRYLVMEFVENSCLFVYIRGERKKQSITQQTFLQLATDIAAGMEYLESQRVIHCDLAARNVLLTREIRAKISDFGLSKILTQDKDYYRRTSEKIIPILWCAPEWIGHKRYLFKSDVWSYGVTIWEMYSYGKTPYVSQKIQISDIMDRLTRGERLEQPRHCPNEIYTVLKSCWELEPNDRPDFKQLKTRFEQFLAASVAQAVVDRSEQAAVGGHEHQPVRGPEQAAVRGHEHQPVRGPEQAAVRGHEHQPVRGPQQAAVEGHEHQPVRGPEQAAVRGHEHQPFRGPEQAAVGAPEQPAVRGNEQTAVRRQSSQTNQARPVSNHNNPSVANIGPPLPNDSTKTNIPVVQNHQQSATKTRELTLTNKTNGITENGQITHTSNTAVQSLSETVVKVNHVENTGRKDFVPHDAEDDETERKEVFKSIAVEGAEYDENEKLSNSRQNNDISLAQGQSLINGTVIANDLNGRQLNGGALSPVSTVARQMSNGLEPSSGKENKKKSETIFIDKRDFHYNVKDILGKGAYGQVFKAKYRDETVALKQCTVDEEYARFKREFELLYSLKQNSTNIVKFIGLYEADESSRNFMYVMEYLEGGSLYNYLITQKQAGNAVDVKQKVLFLIDIAKGMDCLFQRSIVHGDLTTKNVLLTKDLTAKICDLGWAKELESKEENIQYKRKDPAFQALWAAPEIFECVYTKFSDTWSYGVVCIETFLDCSQPSYNVPHNENDQGTNTSLNKLFRAIQKGERLQRPAQCPPFIYNEVIRKCWRKEHTDRIHYTEIIDILSQYNQTSGMEGE